MESYSTIKYFCPDCLKFVYLKTPTSENIEDKNFDFIKLEPIMKCPACGNEMVSQEK